MTEVWQKIMDEGKYFARGVKIELARRNIKHNEFGMSLGYSRNSTALRKILSEEHTNKTLRLMCRVAYALDRPLIEILDEGRKAMGESVLRTAEEMQVLSQAHETWLTFIPQSHLSKNMGYVLAKILKGDSGPFGKIKRDCLVFLDETHTNYENVIRIKTDPIYFDRNTLKHYFLKGTDATPINLTALEREHRAKFISRKN